MRRFILWLLGLRECVECGVIAARWGNYYDVTPPHASSEELAYKCERCSSDGLAYEDMKRGEHFENIHPDSQFTWGGKAVPRRGVSDGQSR